MIIYIFNFKISVKDDSNKPADWQMVPDCAQSHIQLILNGCRFKKIGLLGLNDASQPNHG